MQDSSAFQYLAIDTIRESTANPRQTFEECKLHELAESIRQHGLIQPLHGSPQRGRLRDRCWSEAFPRRAACGTVFRSRPHRRDRRRAGAGMAVGRELAACGRSPLRGGAGLPASTRHAGL